MQRSAVFVDAGYLFAQGSALLKGKPQNRQSILLNIPVVVDAFKKISRQQSGLPLLRIYWYDAIRLGRPNAQQHDLASHADVKIRLGQVNSVGEQKGVDALIITDLADLARNKAMADAVLLTGDEDLRVWVILAQQFGVRVHLVGIKPASLNQSLTLRQEADTTVEWEETEIGSFLSFNDEVSPLAEAAAIASLEDRVGAMVSAIPEEDLRALKADLSTSSNVPRAYDGALLRIGREYYGQQNLSAAERSSLRSAFIRLVTAAAAVADPVA